MKTKFFHLFGIFLLFFFLCDITPVNAQNDNSDYVTISGVVKNKKNKKPLTGVNISVPGTHIGTITNEDGYFTLKTKSLKNVHLIKVSHLGFYNSTLKITEGNITNLDIMLSPKSNYLSEVVIVGLNPSSIVMEALKNVPANFDKKKCMLTGFYRETAQKKSKFISISEAVVDIYKTPYNESINSDRIGIVKGRKLLSPKVSDTLGVKLMGGPYLSVIADIAKNRESFLTPETIGFYNFRMLDTETLDNREQYVIDFEPKFMSYEALYHGKIYVDKEHITFSRIEFSLMMDNKQLATEQILYRKPRGLKFKPLEMSCVVSYKMDEGLAHLNYIKNEIRFKCDWKKKLFATGYRVVSEMVVTDLSSDNVRQIPYKKSFDDKDTFYDKLSDYEDGDFWGSYNIIEPSESLEKAVDKLKKR